VRSETKILEMKNITMTFPGVKALDNVSFDLYGGEVHALVGENGAGKSTLIKVLMGIEKKTAGEIWVKGKKVEIHNALDAGKTYKIATVFQQLSQIPYLTVGENIFLAKEGSTSKFWLKRKEIHERTEKLLKSYGITELKSTDVISNLSTAKRQLSEIVKAISIKPDILVFDEPTSALTENEAELLFNIIETLKKQGVGIIYISHRMNELKVVADRITVLRDGQYIDTRDMAEITMKEIVNLMVGRNVTLYEKREANKVDYNTATKALEVKNLSKKGMFKNLSFDLYQGEILGVAGLVGSGRSELMDIIFGITQADSGEIWINGKKVQINCVQDALKNKIALVPESRHLQGLVLIHSVADNIALPVIRNFQKKLFLNHKLKNKFAVEMINQYDVKTDSASKIVNYLSGGNQQKVVVAKWLATKPKILIVDELTAGIDVNSKAEIHKLISGLTDQGMSVIMISSEMPELLAHSDRVMIMNDYKILGFLENADQQTIMNTIMEDKASIFDENTMKGE